MAATLPAQAAPGFGRTEYAAGGELETYLRVLQTLGEVPAHPWGIRRFSPSQLDRLMPRDSLHPWSRRFDFRPGPPANGVQLTRASAATRWNSDFPIGDNERGVWSGRGVTGTLVAGMSARWDRVSIVAAPMLWLTENRAFDVLTPLYPGAPRYSNYLWAKDIDLPQRFGDKAYGRFDWGQSMIDVQLPGLALAAGTANETWGPGARYPFLIGKNAAGFPHVTLGTAEPANIGIGRLAVQMTWGTMSQSPFMMAPQEDSTTKATFRPTRFINGLIATFQPRGLEHLELGIARLTHAPKPDGVAPLRYYLRALGNPLKSKLFAAAKDTLFDGDNQIASVFARWVFPSSGLELYAEYGKEDYIWDFRYLLLSPDEQVGRLFGFRKAHAHRDGSISVLRGEMLNYEQSNVDRARGGDAIYTHSSGSNQGNTNLGLMLGPPLASGTSAGAELAYDRYSPEGRWTLSWRRDIIGDKNRFRGVIFPLDSMTPWVRHALTAERLWFRGRIDITAGATYARDFNRNFVRDQSGVSAYLGVIAPWR